MSEENAEQRLTEHIERLDRKIANLEQQINSELSPLSDKKPRIDRRSFGQVFWGGALLVLGMIWLAHEEGWIDFRPELLPVILIIFGLYLIFAPRR